ncbi:MAG: SOS response-associated peptidase [Planctomycetota bacterium]
MCGRFALRRLPQQMLLDLKIEDPPDWEPRYNVAPTQTVAIVRERNAARELALVHWGLLPPWAEDPRAGARMINARGETVDTKPAFREAFQRRRCLVLADGYYEWEAIGRRKQPYLIALPADQPFAMAGLWERWYGQGEAKLDPPLESCTIITTEANAQTSGVHDRMPVILDDQARARWLADDSAAAHQSLLKPWEGEMTVTKVHDYVNNARHEGPACVEVLRELF